MVSLSIDKNKKIKIKKNKKIKEVVLCDIR